MTPSEIKALVEPDSPLMKFAFKAAPLETKPQRAEARKAMREAVTALRSFMDGGDVDYEVWQDDEFMSWSSNEADARHYAAVYGQDGPVKLVRVVSFRTDLPTPPAVEGEAGE